MDNREEFRLRRCLPEELAKSCANPMYGREQNSAVGALANYGHYREDINMTECSPFRRPHALIVEDEVMIALGLEALGFEVSGLAANAREAMSWP